MNGRLGRSWEVLGDVYLDSGTLTVQLDASAATGDWLVGDAVCIVRPGRIIVFDAPTMVMTGMAISLHADVVDPTGNACPVSQNPCQSLGLVV